MRAREASRSCKCHLCDGEKNAGCLGAVIHWEQNALKILRSNTIQWQSEIIGCNRANIFNANEIQDTSRWLRGVHLFVRLRDAFKSDRYLMSSFNVELARSPWLGLFEQKPAFFVCLVNHRPDSLH